MAVKQPLAAVVPQEYKPQAQARYAPPPQDIYAPPTLTVQSLGKNKYRITAAGNTKTLGADDTARAVALWLKLCEADKL